MDIDKQIRILVVVNAKFGYDGISSVATNYYRYLDKMHLKMDLVTINPIPEGLKAEIEEDGNKSFVIKERNRNPLKYIFILKKIVSKNKYDIVHIHGNSATMAIELFAAKLGGCRVRVAHSHNTQCDHPKINKLLMPVFNRLYTDCCACSVEAGRFLFGGKECHIVNNGLYLPRYRFNVDTRNKIRDEYGLEDKIVIGHIGRFVYQKNHEFLVRLFETIASKEHEVVLLLVGSGELVEQIKQMVKEKKLEKRVIFYGNTDHVDTVVQAMDCFVFPSIFEGLGIAALEAQAAGLSCIVSDQVPQKVKVNKETIFLSLDDSIEKWVDAVLKRIVTSYEREKSIKKIRKMFEKAGYDIEKNCSDMLIYYYRILDRKGR